MDDASTTRKKTRMVDQANAKYQQSVQQQLSKQNERITSLKRNNDDLKAKLAASTGSKKPYSEQEKASQQQQEIEALEQKVNLEKMKQQDIDKELSLLQMETKLARGRMGGVNVTQDNTAAVDKQVRVLENRLDQALVQFNEALAYNRDLRSTIDSLRGERKVFHEIYKKLEAELHEKKKAMADVIERSNRDYEEREALQSQLQSLRNAAAEDAKRYDDHFAKLDDMLAKYKATQAQQQQQQALQNQQQSRQTTKKEETTTANNNNTTANNNNNNTRATSSEKNTNNNTSKKPGGLNETTTRDDASLDEESEGDLQEIIENLRRMTLVQDLDVLYNKFVKAEETNFSMYNFVNELNAHRERLEAEIAVLKEQLALQKGDHQRRVALKALEDELAKTERQQEQIAEQSEKKREQIKNVCQISMEIFNKISCSKQMAEELLGTQECTELNILNFLGIIEHRTNELLCAWNLNANNDARKLKERKEEENRRRRERRAAERQARIEAGEPVPDDDDEDDDLDDDKPDDTPDTKEKAQVKFLGVQPSTAHGKESAQALVANIQNLPTTNAGDGNGGDGDDLAEDATDILDHKGLREQMEIRLQQKREKEERGGKKRRPKQK